MSEARRGFFSVVGFAFDWVWAASCVRRRVLPAHHVVVTLHRGRLWRGSCDASTESVTLEYNTRLTFPNDVLHDRYSKDPSFPHTRVSDARECLLTFAAHEFWHLVVHDAELRDEERECDVMAISCLKDWRRGTAAHAVRRSRRET